MNLNLNKDLFIINEYLENNKVYDVIDIDELPSDIDMYHYQYIMVS